MAATTYGLEPELKLRVDLLLIEADGKVTLNSAKRSYAEQMKLWLKYLAGNGPVAARPGTSKHEKGLAVDLGGDNATRVALTKKYGLYRTVPSEAWHYELDPKRGPIPTPTKETMADKRLVAVEYADSNLGCWFFYSDGGVKTAGNAPFYGSLGDVALSAPITGVAITPSRKGYMLYDAQGNCYASGKNGKAFGDALYHGGAF